VISEAHARKLFANLGQAFPDAKPAHKVKDAMNKTEAAFALELQVMQENGDVRWWRFEAINLRLAKKTWYRPDFAVVNADGSWTMYEVKGFWRDDARVKIKVAAELYRGVYRFVAVRRVKGRWDYEEVVP
jgi:hypothetical protein